MKKTKSKSSTSTLISSLPAELTTVTTLSKMVAVIVFIALPFIGFLVGVRYEQFAQSVKFQEMLTPIASEMPDSSQTACTMDAMMCPDGSYVGRTGPTCEFSACPGNN